MFDSSVANMLRCLYHSDRVATLDVLLGELKSMASICFVAYKHLLALTFQKLSRSIIKTIMWSLCGWICNLTQCLVRMNNSPTYLIQYSRLKLALNLSSLLLSLKKGMRYLYFPSASDKLPHIYSVAWCCSPGGLAHIRRVTK